MQNAIEKFCKETGLTLEQATGKEEIKGDLDLGRLTSLPSGVSLKAGGYLVLNNLTSLPEGVSLKVGGSLYLERLTSLSEGVSLQVEGHLYLESLTSLPEGVSLKAGRSLVLYSLTSLPAGVSLQVGDYIYLNNLTSLPEGVSLKAGGNLYLSGLTSLPEDVSLKAGGSIYLSGLTSLPEGVSLKAGGSIYLRRLTSISKGVSLKAGGHLYLGILTSIPEGVSNLGRHAVEKEIEWEGGRYRIFDGILCEVLHRKGNVFKVRTMDEKELYVVDNGECFSHGKTIKEARESLIYKLTDRDTSKYSTHTLESTITKAEAIQVYRAVTGACEIGTRMFVEAVYCPKEVYTVREVIDLTEGRYGSEQFKAFFKK